LKTRYQPAVHLHVRIEASEVNVVYHFTYSTFIIETKTFGSTSTQRIASLESLEQILKIDKHFDVGALFHLAPTATPHFHVLVADFFGFYILSTTPCVVKERRRGRLKMSYVSICLVAMRTTMPDT
jgi:hypothetical protein